MKQQTLFTELRAKLTQSSNATWLVYVILQYKNHQSHHCDLDVSSRSTKASIGKWNF